MTTEKEHEQSEQAENAVGIPLDRRVGHVVPKRAKNSTLSCRQREAMKTAPDDWADLPSGMGCTNATLCALERRGLVETRIEPSQRHSWYAGWQWRKTPNV